MDETWKLVAQLGAGVASLYLVYLIIGLLQRKKGSNGASGEKSVDFWRLEIRQMTLDALKIALVPMVEQQVRLLDDLNKTNQDIKGAIIEIKLIVERTEGSSSIRFGVRPRTGGR